jgi:hypothetical protein
MTWILTATGSHLCRGLMAILLAASRLPEHTNSLYTHENLSGAPYFVCGLFKDTVSSLVHERRYIHLRKAMLIHKRHTHPLVRRFATMTERVELQKKKTLVVNLKGLGAKTN